MSARIERTTLLRDAGGVLVTWIALLAIENAAVGALWHAQFVGAWEMMHARVYLAPLALGATLPLAFVLATLGAFVSRGRAWETTVLAALGGGVFAYGVSFGRRMSDLTLRVPFVLVVAICAGGAAFVLARKLPALRPKTAALGGLTVALAAWFADAFVLVRLYPALHWLLFVVTVIAWSATWLFVREHRFAKLLSPIGLAVAVLSLAWTPRAAKAVSTDDNLRRVLLEHAPLLGRSVVLANHIAPPPPLEDDASLTTTSVAAVTPAPVRALDWTGRDILLLTVDALRADHLSSYGYSRPTTPNIDRLAAGGVRFAHAYCPTPHTSYSVTSLMTGKYMRPLLAMGAGDDSETWADYLRHYGYRTAAFYPPAVFFIDEHRFSHMKARSLGFEYKKEEFAGPELRGAQVASYLETAPKDKPLFMWVHAFEPHEPYVAHPEHVFAGGRPVDAYDSEVAAADALIGSIVALFEAKRPGAIVIVSADHGEEFDDHGGRYHGTTVYEEQVRVPLVVHGPGIAPRVVDAPVQTIDLLPTVLSSLDIPLPARVRGRDLGGVISGKAEAGEGLAFSETDDHTLVARGKDRLVCARKIASCTLFDLAQDPTETKADTSRPERTKELRRVTAGIERENGTLEKTSLPEALRRGLQGDRDAAEDIAPLFDDARVDIRRLATQCAFRLRAPELENQLGRALAHDEDAQVRSNAVLALARTAKDLDPRVVPLLSDADARVRRDAALVLAEHGDGRGESELVHRWEVAFAKGAKEHGELDEARELLAAFAKIRARGATPALLSSLADVRLRPHVVDALAAIGDPAAKRPIFEFFEDEPYANVRPKEARALAILGAKEELLPGLVRYASAADPMVEAIAIARDAGLLRPNRGGIAWDGAPKEAKAVVTLEAKGPYRLFVLTADDTGVAEAALGTETAKPLGRIGPRTFQLDVANAEKGPITLSVAQQSGLLAAWMVPRAAAFDAPAHPGLESPGSVRERR